MSNVDQLLGEIREFKRATLEEIRELKVGMKDLNADVKDLNRFKWRLTGAAGVAIFLCTLVVELLKHAR